MENSLISKISIVLLITVILSLISTVCFAAEELPPVSEVPNVWPNLYSKVYFTGSTYLFNNGTIKRKTYTEKNQGSGIVGMVLPNNPRREYSIYIIGEGWISYRQIIPEKTTSLIKFPGFANTYDNQEDVEANAKVDDTVNNKVNTNSKVENNNTGNKTLKLPGFKTLLLKMR